MKVILHICCGVCAAGAAEVLLSENHRVTGYFYNPNIYPYAEYQRRLDTAVKVAAQLDFPIEAGQYDSDNWMVDAEPFKNEPEGGQRCLLCYRIRLQNTYNFMLSQNADAFTTTLTIGPSKSAARINEIGQTIGGDKFLPRDFKKKDGFKRAIARSNQWQLYRQNYCGCVYSVRGNAT
ncbi:MAG: epoxyqueuosine reductase QueH [Dehalococcoidia bacterium]|nr:epoxyqueuosine reductase QueH [Dehalococcoidia bacterium]MDD5494297.1 epoxyqueuosine reductase QueH [Dehalococcoidia bacterium]